MSSRRDMAIVGIGWTLASAALSFSCAGSLLGQLLMFIITGWFGPYMIALGISDYRKDKSCV